MKRVLLGLVLTVAACGESRVIAEVSVDGTPVAGLPVWLLPYDRVALVDSLVQESDEPEPAIPATLLEELESVRAGAASAEGDTLVAELRARRRALEARVDSIRLARRAWRDRVYAPLDSLAREREGAHGVRARSDTTDARGRARVPAEEGRYWLWSVYVLPESTLEWSVPVVLRGDSVTVRMERGTARERRVH
jgi:hypothetical protein